MDTLPNLFASTDGETLASMLDSIGDAVCMVDSDLRFVAATRLFAMFYGMPDPNMLMNKVAFEVYPDFAKSVFYQACRSTIDTGETHIRFGFSHNLNKWVVIRCYMARPNRYVMVVHRVTQGMDKTAYAGSEDALTSLPNRLAFENDAQNLRDFGQQRISLTLLDISHFKHLNETLGFDTGDKCLMALASRLKRAALGTDRVYRAGNDQFLIMGSGDEADIVLRRAQLLDALAQPMELNGADYVLQFHVGTHVCDHPETPIEGLARAERALLLAKTQRTQEVRYSPSMGTSDYDPRLTKEIQDAMALGQFELFYQPQVDSIDGKALGSEALVRWRHPERGLVPPIRFLPFAEQTGLIEDIDRHVMRLAFRQAKAWSLEGKFWPLSVNLSAQSLCNPTIVDLFRLLLDETQLDPSLISLEITETSIMHDAQTSQMVIESLKDMGFEIGIDDFGTGYASMAYLARYPAHTLKIDRSFVQGMENDPPQRVMVKNMIALARSLGIKVVAEGVETESQAQTLREYDCDVLQGYLYSPPLPLEKFEAWVATVGMSSLGSDLR